MNTDKKNEEVDVNEAAITLEVDGEVIDKLRKGEITHILMDIDEDNQNLVLENAGGNLILVTDEMPTTFHGCYLYNNGEFPYAIKRSLEFLVLANGNDNCLTRIIDVNTEPIKRFNYQGAGKPIVEDANGDSCVWEVSFEVVPVPVAPRYYLMRWNPSISSFTEKDYEECMKNQVHGMFRLNWSINEWEEARRGDIFYMMRVGDDKAGLVFNGQFISDPYPGEDWAGSTKRRMYVDMICMNAAEAGAEPVIPLAALQKAIPAIEWSRGHSGVRLADDVIDELVKVMDESNDI